MDPNPKETREEGNEIRDAKREEGRSDYPHVLNQERTRILRIEPKGEKEV